MDFGSVLKSLRHRHNMTQKNLADALGVSESTVGMYERGKREPDFETLEQIADYFNVDMDYLTGRSSTERRYSYSQNGISDEAMRIARAYDRADEKSQGLVRYALAEYIETAKGEAAQTAG